MLRRPSTGAESTTSSTTDGGDVTFDDMDDSQVFAYLDEGDEVGALQKPPAPRTVEFRLDFSSRINPAPLVSPGPMARRASTSSVAGSGAHARHTSSSSGNASGNGSPGHHHTGSGSSSSSSSNSTTGRLQRSPSMRTTSITQLPFRKRLSRRPSELVPEIESSTSAAAMKSSAVRPESLAARVSPLGSSSTAPLPITVGPQVVSLPVPPHPSKASPPAPPPPAVNDRQNAAAQAAAAQAQAAAVAAAAFASAAAIEKLQDENESLRSDLQNARALIAELHQRLRATEEQNEDALAQQLLTVQADHAQRVECMEEEHARIRTALVHQYDAELAEIRHQYDKDREAAQLEKDAKVMQLKNELLHEKEKLHNVLHDHAAQSTQLHAQFRTLEEELRLAREETQRLSQQESSHEAQCGSLQVSADHWEAQCQTLQDHVHQLLHEQEQSRVKAASETLQQTARQAKHQEIQKHFAAQVQLLQGQLKTLASETRELIKKEMKKTAQVLLRMQQQASDVAIQQNDKAMALVAKQNRLIQLETQLKNERQSVNQLQTSLATTTRTLHKKEALFKAKYHEQKEFLEITVAVRNGLTNELQDKRRQVEELDVTVIDLQRRKDAVEKKNRQLMQQVKIMQHVHVREMEQVALLRQQQGQGQPHGQAGQKRTSNSSSRRHSTSSGSGTWNGSGQLQQKATEQKRSDFSLAAKPTSSASLLSSSSSSGGEGSLLTDHQALGEDEEDRSGRERRQRVPEDDVFAAAEWREFVELVALHEAESNYHGQHQHQQHFRAERSTGVRGAVGRRERSPSDVGNLPVLSHPERSLGHGHDFN